MPSGRISAPLFLALAACLSPLGVAAQGLDTFSRLRGELVRFADTSVQVSVIAAAHGDVPETLWERIRTAGDVRLLPGGLASADDGVRSRLDGLLPATAITTVFDPSELAPLGVEVSAAGEVRLVWYGQTEAGGVAILADARAAEDDFSLRILIPDPTGTDFDWWGLQAALSQAGIRQVQILSGGAP